MCLFSIGAHFAHQFDCCYSLVATSNLNYNRLYKICKLLDVIFPKFELEYTLHPDLSTDEAMIAFQRRLSFKQYI